MVRVLGLVDLELMEGLFQGLPDSPFFIKDRELRYVAANPAMADLCGVRQAEDLYGKTAADVFPQLLARRYEAMDRLVLENRGPIANKLELARSRRGGPAWLLFSRLPVRGGDGSIVGVAANSRRLKPPGASNATYERLSAVLTRLEADFHQPLRLAELSALAGVSPSQLERDFKTLFRLSIRDFLQKTRIQRALERLESSDSIAAIAYDCGYTDQSAFTRSFKRVTGISPRDYRRRILV